MRYQKIRCLDWWSWWLSFAPGAAGNLATEDLVSMAHQMGYDTGIDEKALLETSHFAGEIIGQQIGGRMAGWMTYQMSK